MPRTSSSRWRRVLASLAYGALVVLVVSLGYLTFEAVRQRRLGRGEPSVAAKLDEASLIVIDRFATRIERSAGVERLTVSFRARSTSPGKLDCQVFIAARNDRAAPKLWAVWPPQAAGQAFTSGGHFRGHDPESGQSVSLTSKWTRISGSVAHPRGRPPFDTVIVYLVGEKGQILVARPFAL